MSIGKVNYIKQSPNNRAKCKNCENRIRKGEPRANIDTFYGDGYLCFKCTSSHLGNEIKRYKGLQKEFKKCFDKCSDKIIINELSK